MALTANESLKRLMSAQFKARGLSAADVPMTESKPNEIPEVASKKHTSSGIDFAKLRLQMQAKQAIPTPVQSTELTVPAPVPALIDPVDEITDAEWEHIGNGGEHGDFGVNPEDVLADSIADYEDAMRDAGVYDQEHWDSATARATNILEGVTFGLDDSQKAAVIGLVNTQRGCLMGAAGTGKTTTTRFVLNALINGIPSEGIEPLRLAAVDLSKYNGGTKAAKAAVDDSGESIEVEEEESAPASEKIIVPAIAMVAFTGQAVQVIKGNMPGTWRRNVMTIHSLLGYAPETYTNEKGEEKWRFAPTYTRQIRMPWDVIIIDEASMVNLQLWHELLDAAKDTARIYWVGDLNQLVPAVGQGIFGFALAKLPVFELTTIHRQADEAANKIIDTAWGVLKGKFNPDKDLDDPTTNPNWRVIGMKLDNDSEKAHRQIVAIAKGLAGRKTLNGSAVYDPWRDRIMTPMNGFREESEGAMLGQFPLNDSLSQVFADKAQPRIVIDAKKITKKFSVGYRVMATKNEPANTIDRVTNGLTGKILNIERNPDWVGDWRLVGEEDVVKANRVQMVQDAFAIGNNAEAQSAYAIQQASEALDAIDFSAVEGLLDQKPEERQSGPSSHIVTVKFDNGATRMYNLNAEVEQLQIAYASTVHKAQGSEMPTAIVVVHHRTKRMLFRESLYTAVTRAKERVIFLYTDYGFRIALANQKISGATLPQKIEQYIRLMGESELAPGFKLVNVRLTAEENDAFHARKAKNLFGESA